VGGADRSGGEAWACKTNRKSKILIARTLPHTTPLPYHTVGSKKGKGGGKVGKGGAAKPTRDGPAATGPPKGGKRSGSKPAQKSSGVKRAGAGKGGEEEEDDEEALAQREERDGIEKMDVDDFMKSGMFGGEDGGESAEEEEDAEEEEGGLEGGEESDDDDQEEMEEGDDEEMKEEEGEEADEEEDMLEDEVKQHKAELERLKAKDPDFFKFLEKNDGNLLSFGQDEEEGEDEEEDDEGEEEEEEKEGEEEDEEPTAPTTMEEEAGGPKELTLALLKTIEHAALEQHSLKGLRKLVLAFKAASHMADESSRHGPSQQAYNIASSSVFDRLLVTCLTSLPEAFGHHLFQNPDYSSVDPAPFAKLGSIPAFRSLRPMVYRTLKALHYLLGQVTESSLLSFLLSRLERFLPFLIPFPRLAKFYLKTFLSLWATSEALDVKLSSFLRIRQAATVLPFPFLEHCLKGTYLSYARNAKFVTETSLPGLTLMGNCLVELYGLDMTSAYQHAFVYLRQLALHLRAAYTKKTPEALQKVYCWQFLNCCKVWVAVLTAYPSLPPSSSSSSSEQQQQQLRELVFPLAQILIGMIKLAPSARHYPLALHALTLLQRLAARAHVFIPCASSCLDMLENPAFQKKGKPTTDPPPSLLLALKLTGKSGIEFKNVQESLVNECMDVLTQELLIYRYTIALPEYVFPIKERVKKWAKNTKNARWRALARGVVDECEKWGKWVEKERTRRELAPTDKGSFEALFPQGGGREGGREGGEMDAGGRLKLFLGAKAVREGLGGEEAMLAQQQQEQQQQKQQQQQKLKGGKKGKAAVVEEEEQEEEQEQAEKKIGKKGAKKQQKQQQQQQQKGVPVERMEDEVGALGEWSDEDVEEGEEEGEGLSADDSE